MPISSITHLTPTSILAVWRLTESADDLANGLQHRELYAAKVATLKPESRRMREILAVRRLLKEVSDGKEWAIEYDADGRPATPDGAATLSISHTEGHVAVLTADAGSCPGVDIERLGHRVARVASRFLMPAEQQLLAEVEPQLQALCPMPHTEEQPSNEAIDPIGLHVAWSAKETAYKVLGTTHYDLQHKTTVVRVDVDKRLIEVHAEGISEPLLIGFRIDSEYVLTFLNCSFTK